MARQRRTPRRKGRLARMAGQPPGTVIANPDAPRPMLRVLAYGPESFVERAIQSPEEVKEFLATYPVTWLDASGLGDATIIKAIGAIFGMHPLVLEDIVDTTQRPKLEVYDDRLFIVLRNSEWTDTHTLEQFSIFVGDRFVVTFQETPHDCLDELRDRIRKGRGRVRRCGAPYLAYALVDAIVDGFFPLLEKYSDELEELESAILERPDASLIGRLFEIKRELLSVRRAVWPTRDVAGALAEESTVMDADVRLYARDAHDHAARILDLVESFRELASSMLDVYLATVSNRMNETMRVLTIISTIFIPMSFIAGVYGMNFDPDVSPWNMPEIRWYFGYPFALAIMGLMFVAMMLMFWRRGWFRGATTSSEDGER